MIRKLVPLVVLVCLLAAGSIVATGITGAATAFAIPCDPDVDPDCDPGGGETVTFVNTDLDVAPPAAGNVDDVEEAQVACGTAGSDCHGDYQYTRRCADFDCTLEDLDTVTLSGTGGPAGYSPQFSYCPANSPGTGCVGASVACSVGDCPILMDDDYRATLTWVDVQPPDTSFTSPRTVVGPAANDFTATGSDNSGVVTRVRFSIDGTFKAEDSSPGDGFTYSVNPGDFMHGSMHTLEAQAFDAANNADGSPVSTPFTVDRLTTVNITAPAANGHFQSAPLFSFDKDPDATATCSTMAGTSGETSVHSAACTSSYTPQPTGDGPYRVRVSVVDAVGNAATDERAFVKDDSDPNLTITSPTAGERVKPPFTPAFTASDGQTAAQDLVVACKLETEAGFGGCGARSPVDGTHTLEVMVTDKAGNQRTGSVIFISDGTGPQITGVTGPADGGIVTTSSVTYGWTASDDSTPLESRCKLDGGVFGACTSGSSHQLDGLGEGSHAFALRVTDALGNATELERDFFVNAVRPTADITGGPGEGEVIRTREATFRFNAAGGAVTCSLDSETAFGPCSGADSHAVGGLGDGGHTFRVRVVDESDDVVVKSRTFTVDTSVVVPPRIVEQLQRQIARLQIRVGNLWSVFPRTKKTQVKSLIVRNVPANGKVEVSCKGRGCAFKTKTATVRNGRANLTKLFKTRKMAARTRIEIRVTAPDAIGAVFVFTTRPKTFPKVQQLCLQPGASTPGAC